MVLLVDQVDAFCLLRLGPEPNSVWSKKNYTMLLFKKSATYDLDMSL